MVHNGVMGRLEQYFHRPEEFLPERWLQEDRDNPLYGECVCVCEVCVCGAVLLLS